MMWSDPKRNTCRLSRCQPALRADGPGRIQAKAVALIGCMDGRLENPPGTVEHGASDLGNVMRRRVWSCEP